LMKTLREADKEPSFSRFLDLSAELRNEIYKIAIEDINVKDSSRVRPVTPAISRTNRQIRNETLPLFFRGICQTIVVSSFPVGQFSHRLQQAKFDVKYQDYFNHAIKVGWLQHIRRFQFRLMGETLGRNGQPKKHWDARYYVQFANNTQSVETKTGEEEDKQGLLSKIMAGMATVVDGESTVMTAKEFWSMIAFFLATVDLRCAE
jgi:hypothetical protein